jgi:predicted nucleotidyltransferase
MDKTLILAKLPEYEDELKAAGIKSLVLHGSDARGTVLTEASDVDVVAEFDQAKRMSLLGRIHLENRLTDIFGIKADLADRRLLHPDVRESVQRESILVF